MDNSNSAQRQTFWQSVRAVFERIGEAFSSVGHFFKVIGTILFRLRKFFMAAPVILVALRLAQNTKEQLQGAFRFHILDVLASFEASDLIIREVEISKQVAVAGPLVVTAACLLLMFFSRKTLYPWIISIFSLVIPIFILFSAQLPA